MSGIGSESAFESSKYTIWEGAAIRCLCLSTTSNKLTPHTQKFPNQQCQKHPYAPVLCVQSVQEDLHEKSVKAILTVEEPVLNNAYCSGKGSVASKSLFLQNHLTLAQTFRKKRQICQAQKQRARRKCHQLSPLDFPDAVLRQYHANKSQRPKSWILYVAQLPPFGD